MRAVPSQAFVAPLQISPARFCLALAAVAALFGALVAYTLIKGMEADPTAAQLRAFAIPIAGFAAVIAFVFLLAVSAPVWWALDRLKLHGWATALLAGGVLATALCAIPTLLARDSIQSPAPLWLLVLAQSPLGFFYGWVIWRIAYRPREAAPNAPVQPTLPADAEAG